MSFCSFCMISCLDPKCGCFSHVEDVGCSCYARDEESDQGVGGVGGVGGSVFKSNHWNFPPFLIGPVYKMQFGATT